MLSIDTINELIKHQSDCLSNKKISQALAKAIEQIDINLNLFFEKYPTAASKNLKYGFTDNRGWTTGFWTGLLWLSFEHTKNEKYKIYAEHFIKDFRSRYENKIDFSTHDLGFLYTLSCVNAYKITGNEFAKETAILAADELCTRFKDKGQFIQAWGDINDEKANRLIIDCMLNLPLLFWASEVTGEKKYYDIAYSHAKTCMDVIVRSDNSTYHTFYFNPKTGEKEKGVTAQGFSDNSCWSRGQAWGIYGCALSYKYTKDKRFIECNKGITDYFIEHLPTDLVAYWDLIFTNGNEERDSSAAAIAVCGLLEMSKYVDKQTAKHYTLTAKAILNSLIDNYSTTQFGDRKGLIEHSVYSKPGNSGVDEYSLWGDYYYMEALIRMSTDWNMYW